MNGVENKRILELEKENKRLAAKNKELEEKLEEANLTVMAYTEELQTREVIKVFGKINRHWYLHNLIRNTVINGTVNDTSPTALQSISFRLHWT